MSCSSNRKRLVGSCIRTLVSSTNSLLAGTRRVAGPDLAEGLADLRITRVNGAGRILRSTMSLLDDVGYGDDLRLPANPSARSRGTQAMVDGMAEKRQRLWLKSDPRTVSPALSALAKSRSRVRACART